MLHRVRGREGFRHPTHDAGKIQNAEEDEHQADGELHGEADARRDDDAEENDGGADGENGKCVAESPKNPDEGRVADAPLAADDGGDGDDVVGIGSVAHAQEETENHDRDESDHFVFRRQLRPDILHYFP